MPEKWNRYIEPFAGGLSVFFALCRERRVGAATLGDANVDLMDTYRVVRSRPKEVVKILRSWRYSRERFEKLCCVRRTVAWFPEDAARFIYLNRTCANGLYRVNQKGEFEVPFGGYKNPTICDEKNISAVSGALRGVLLFTGSYVGCLREIEAGDFVYCDPPDTAEEFGPEEQAALADTLDCLNKKRVKWLLSNQDTEWVKKRYRDYRVEVVANGRRTVGEVIIRNY